MSGFSVALSLSSFKFHSIQQDWLHIEVEDAKFGSFPDLLGRPDVLEHDKNRSSLANPGCDISVYTPLSFNCTPKVDVSTTLLQVLQVLL